MSARKNTSRYSTNKVYITNEKSCLLVLAAATDELNLTEDQLCAVMIRTDRYANYIDDHIVRLKDMQKSIEKNTGIKLRGWI